MGVSAQHQGETSVRGLSIDFRSVREQDRDITRGNLRRRFFDVVGAIEMRVVDPREVNVAPHLHLACLSSTSPIGPRHAKRYLDRCLCIKGKFSRCKKLSPWPKA